jgi:hypothetical protein
MVKDDLISTIPNEAKYEMNVKCKIVGCSYQLSSNGKATELSLCIFMI